MIYFESLFHDELFDTKHAYVCWNLFFLSKKSTLTSLWRHRIKCTTMPKWHWPVFESWHHVLSEYAIKKHMDAFSRSSLILPRLILRNMVKEGFRCTGNRGILFWGSKLKSNKKWSGWCWFIYFRWFGIRSQKWFINQS